jgi:toxin CptA
VKEAPAIGFHYRASSMLAVATIGVVVLAIAALSWVGGPGWLHGLLLLAIVAYGSWSLISLLRPPVKSVLWRADGGAELTLQDEVSGPRGEVQGAVAYARVLGPLIVLTLRWPPRERMTLWLLPDNLDRDTRRRLRMRLGNATAAGLASGSADSH